ncbi:GTPase IMAP family member 9 [Labeo rohita]|uniref:GTPase IMAP family member 9 n=2 Tax=Labeo rohita TaxID=84645 RepID=A0ABQ8MLF0_LABRO|nr:GTPase IMAP family member 9 [Labeo rohita]
MPNASPNSATKTSVRQDGTVNGRKLTVIDTPGPFDTSDRDDETIKTEIIRAITECAPGIDAFVIVLKVDRFTKQEIEIVKKIGEYCGEDTFKHAVVLFTHGEQLKGQTIEEFVQRSTKLQELVDKCGGRCHVIDNTYWKRCLYCPCSCGYKSNNFQVKNLLDTINEMVQVNGRYTNELMLTAEQEIQKEMKNENNGNLPSEERRERAKKNVFEKFVRRLAGVTTGILVGAFLGIGVAVASVVALLKGTNYSIACKGVSLGIAAAEAAAAAAGAGAGGAAAGAGVVAAKAGIATAAGAAALEAGVATGAGIGAAAGAGIAAGVLFGSAALAGAIGGGITGYNAAEQADSVLESIKNSAKANYEKSKRVVEKAEQLPLKARKKI